MTAPRGVPRAKPFGTSRRLRPWTTHRVSRPRRQQLMCPSNHPLNPTKRRTAEATKRPVAKIRPLMGRWVKNLGEEEVKRLIGEAQAKGILDPVSWIEARVREATDDGRKELPV